MVLLRGVSRDRSLDLPGHVEAGAQANWWLSGDIRSPPNALVREEKKKVAQMRVLRPRACALCTFLFSQNAFMGRGFIERSSSKGNVWTRLPAKFVEKNYKSKKKKQTRRLYLDNTYTT